MIRILHLVDPSLGWEQQIALSQLLGRLPGDQFFQTVVRLGGATASGHSSEERVPWFDAVPWLSAPRVRRAMERHRADVVHAWSLPAALPAATGGRPLLVSLFDPCFSRRQLKIVRALDGPAGLGIACASGTVRRRLIEGGVAASRCAVIRPGVDFGWLRRLPRGEARRSLGIAEADYVVAVAGPPRRDGGQMEVAFAGQLASFVTDRIRVVVPGESAEAARIRRFYARQPRPGVLFCPEASLGFPSGASAVRAAAMPGFVRTILVADVLVAAAFHETSTTAIAWAMGAGVAVAGVADYAVAELITHKVNGVLFKPVKGEGRAVTVARLLIQRSLLDGYRETARGQAYEVFGVRRCIEQYIRLYENVLAGRGADEGIVDSALSA